MTLGKRAAALKVFLDAKPGAKGEPMTASRGSAPLVLLYKIMGKMFAILSVRDEAFVILKCDPDLAELLRERYAGVGHRSHLDRRFWISVDLESDVPTKEVRALVDRSYGLVRDTLTKKQKADLDALVS